MRNVLLSGVLAALVADAAAAKPAFRADPIASDGRTVAAELADFDGDGRTDLMQVLFRDNPPHEQRLIRVTLQGEDGALPPRPTFERPLPAGAAAYDVHDLRESPGSELVLLRQSDVLVLSLASASGTSWSLPFPGPGSVGALGDDRGLERIAIVYPELGREPRLLAVQLGETTVLAAGGEVLGRLQTGGLANYLVPTRPGLLFFESDLRLFFDAPRVSIGDVDGDGSGDVVTSTRHEVRVFLQEADGRFDAKASRVYPLDLLSEHDHIRGSGGVTAQTTDLDGDGRADLVLSHQSGGLTDARLITRIYRNVGGGWQLDAPAQTIDSQGAIGSELALDIDRDGRPELVRVIVPFSTMGLVQTLLTRTFGAEARIYPSDPKRLFASDPWVKLDLDIPFSFDTLRTAGFLPCWTLDLNADGNLDLLLSGKGDRLEVRLGGTQHRYGKVHHRMKLPTQGLLRGGDWNGDGLVDLLIFDPFTNDAPAHLLVNLGTLPNSPPRFEAAPAPPAEGQRDSQR